MKRPAAYIIVSLLFFAAFSETGWAVDNYISPATIPPSSRREGLIRTPNPADGSGNLLVTGNIRGPAYFRGVVPYYAPTNFGVTLPSSSLDSFLRDSVGAGDAGRYNRYSGYNLGYRPYYSPTQTVASTIPGAPAMPGVPSRVGASAVNITPDALQSYISGTLPVRRDEVLDTTSALSLARLRPMSMTPEEMEKLISSEIAEYSPARLTEQQYQPKMEQYNPEINRESYKNGEVNNPLTSLLLPPAPKQPGGEVNQPFGIPTQEEQTDEEAVEIPFGAFSARDLYKHLDVYDQMKQQIDDLQKKLELALVAQQAEKAAGSATGEGGKKPAEGQTQESSQAEKLAETELSVARTKSILGPFETFASFSEDKFNQNMRAGEQYLKQGRYYRAADAYTLASLYKPDDPLAYAGKSHALFVSGEYMSSALFLSRCLQIFPEYARFKIDIEAMVGGRDKLETRVVDVEEWLGKSGAPELQFLLAYVYYQMDRPQPAKKAIGEAYKMMPQDPAVLALKKAIEDSPATDKDGSSQRITDDAVKK